MSSNCRSRRTRPIATRCHSGVPRRKRAAQPPRASDTCRDEEAGAVRGPPSETGPPLVCVGARSGSRAAGGRRSGPLTPTVVVSMGGAVSDRSTRRWRHLDLGAVKLFVEAEIRRLHCRRCGRVRTEEVPWARPRARHTRDFEDVVAWLVGWRGVARRGLTEPVLRREDRLQCPELRLGEAA